MFRQKLNQEGFTLVEIILTIVVLGVGLYGGFALFQSASYNNIDNDFRIVGSKLASEKIEQVMADKTFNGFDSIDTADYPVEAMQPPHSQFTRTTTITRVSGNDFTTADNTSGYKRVDVLVSWGAANDERVTISTVVSQY